MDVAAGADAAPVTGAESIAVLIKGLPGIMALAAGAFSRSYRSANRNALSLCAIFILVGFSYTRVSGDLGHTIAYMGGLLIGAALLATFAHAIRRSALYVLQTVRTSLNRPPKGPITFHRATSNPRPTTGNGKRYSRTWLTVGAFLVVGLLVYGYCSTYCRPVDPSTLGDPVDLTTFSPEYDCNPFPAGDCKQRITEIKTAGIAQGYYCWPFPISFTCKFEPIYRVDTFSGETIVSRSWGAAVALFGPKKMFAQLNPGAYVERIGRCYSLPLDEDKSKAFYMGLKAGGNPKHEADLYDLGRPRFVQFDCVEITTIEKTPGYPKASR